MTQEVPGRRPIEIRPAAANDRCGFASISFEGKAAMKKRDLIDRIMRLNRSARAEFLATFSEEELRDYLRQLKELSLEQRTENLMEGLVVTA